MNMATVEGSSSSSPSSSSSSSSSLMDKPQSTTEIDNYSLEKALKSLEQVNPWIEQASQQAMEFRKTVEDNFESAMAVTQSRLSQIRSTSSAHFQQTLDTLVDLKGEYAVYEHKFFGNVKEGALIAASHPLIATGAAVGLGSLALKGPRRFLYYRTLRLFSSEEAMLSRADAKVKELRQSFESLKAETETLEKHALSAEEEMKRARTKLRDAGVLIRKAVHSTHKIEKQATGLKDILADLPRREASKFRSEISGVVSEAKKERKVLSKEVTKISNYGISV